MSYRIEYRYQASRVPPSIFKDGMARFFVCIEGGDNNCYENTGRNARRARSWSVCMIGTKDEIMERACYFAGSCESEGLQPNGRSCTAEQYIRKIRKLVELADSPSNDYAERFTLRYKCIPNGEHDKILTAAGISRRDGKNEWTDNPAAIFDFETPNGDPDYKLFFETIHLLGPKHAAWDSAKCNSLY